MDMTPQEKLESYYEGISTGIEYLKKLKERLDYLNKNRKYQLSNIKLSSQEGRITFNYHWIKCFAKLQVVKRVLENKIDTFTFKYKIIWGRYDNEDDREIEKDIVQDSEISYGPGTDRFIRNNDGCDLDNVEGCASVIDKIIWDCLPESLIEIQVVKKSLEDTT